MERHFTTTAYIIEDDKTLLIHHRKFGKWLPPGGHIHPDETPPEAARREVKEETGLEIEFLHDEHIWIEEPNASSFERPFMCLLENIPAYKETPQHQHIDMIYLAKPVGGSLQHNEDETHAIRWFNWEEINSLKVEEEIFKETVDTLKTIFENKDSFVIG